MVIDNLDWAKVGISIGKQKDKINRRGAETQRNAKDFAHSPALTLRLCASAVSMYLLPAINLYTKFAP
jgi:hypothetical protein